MSDVIPPAQPTLPELPPEPPLLLVVVKRNVGETPRVVRVTDYRTGVVLEAIVHTANFSDKGPTDALVSIRTNGEWQRLEQPVRVVILDAEA